MSAPVNREAWLEAAVQKLRPLFEREGHKVPPCRVAVGFPSRGALSAKKKRVGECWSPKASADGVSQIFINPTDPEKAEGPNGVLAVLAHEIIHAIEPDVGHKVPFKRIAVAIGLEGKMTATVAGEALCADLATIAEDLGPYPHAILTPGLQRKKQTTRLIKVACPACEYPARVTRKWLDQAGPPSCPCGEPMIEEVPE